MQNSDQTLEKVATERQLRTMRLIGAIVFPLVSVAGLLMVYYHPAPFFFLNALTAIASIIPTAAFLSAFCGRKWKQSLKNAWQDKNRCGECGYEIEGAEICPECGNKQPPKS